jgi:hypothetical protein
MQQLVSLLTQFNGYQLFFLTINIILSIIFIIAAIVAEKAAAIVNSTLALVIATGSIIMFTAFMHQREQAVSNHEYTTIKNQKTLEIQSKSDMIKNYKFTIDSEDDHHLYVKHSSLWATNSYVIDKSEVDQIND